MGCWFDGVGLDGRFFVRYIAARRPLCEAIRAFADLATGGPSSSRTKGTLKKNQRQVHAAACRGSSLMTWRAAMPADCAPLCLTQGHAANGTLYFARAQEMQGMKDTLS